ncbi:hypothetical protein LY78DRAFT_464609 [Colletotrichum sublineola]|nr:hypothetical protein LY78DRAFT_464609 [Colletotrichum sublineola]
MAKAGEARAQQGRAEGAKEIVHAGESINWGGGAISHYTRGGPQMLKLPKIGRQRWASRLDSIGIIPSLVLPIKAKRGPECLPLCIHSAANRSWWCAGLFAQAPQIDRYRTPTRCVCARPVCPITPSDLLVLRCSGTAAHLSSSAVMEVLGTWPALHWWIVLLKLPHQYPYLQHHWMPDARGTQYQWKHPNGGVGEM